MGCGISSRNSPMDQPKLFVPSTSIFGSEMETRKRLNTVSVKNIRTLRTTRTKTDPLGKSLAGDFTKCMIAKHMSTIPAKKSAKAKTIQILRTPDTHVETQLPVLNQCSNQLLSLDSPKCLSNQVGLKSTLTRSTFNGSNDSKCNNKVFHTEATIRSFDKSAEIPSFEECKNSIYEYSETNINLYSS